MAMTAPQLALMLALASGCGGTAATQSPAAPDEPAGPSAVLAEDDAYQPSYGAPELSRALIAERAAEATAAQRLVELEAQPDGPVVDVPRDATRGGVNGLSIDDQLRVAAADLAVRRRFITTLEACEAERRWCPPRLDDPAWAFDPDPDQPAAPPMTAPLAFELAGWRVLAGELHGRACACRSLICVDSVGVAIEQLERQPAREVAGDHTASLSITRARECLFRLRGKAGSLVRRTQPPAP